VAPILVIHQGKLPEHKSQFNQVIILRTIFLPQD